MSGPPGPALRLLAAADPSALGVREPSLEEIFLDYYGDRRMSAARPPVGEHGLRPAGFGPALVWHAFRLVRRGALIVVVVAAGHVGAGRGAVPQPVRRRRSTPPRSRRWPTNPAIRILFGRPVALDDPGGFTVWRTGTPLAVLVARLGDADRRSGSPAAMKRPAGGSCCWPGGTGSAGWSAARLAWSWPSTVLIGAGRRRPWWPPAPTPQGPFSTGRRWR